MLLIRGRQRGRDRAAFLDAAIISTGFGVLGGVFVVAPVAVNGGASLLSQVVAGADPVADLLLLAALIRLLTGGAARNLAFWSLVGGLTITMAVDIQYVLSVLSGVWFPDRVKVGCLVGYLLIGFAAKHPSVDLLSQPTPERLEHLTPARLVALGLALALAPLTELLAGITDVEANPFIVASGAPIGTFLVLARMVGLLRELESQAVRLAALARNDGLTGLANRRTWDHELSRVCAEVRDNDFPLTVALLDLDHFKAFNDTQGHVMGDLVLKETAAAWQQALYYAKRSGRNRLAVHDGNVVRDSVDAGPGLVVVAPAV